VEDGASTLALKEMLHVRLVAPLPEQIQGHIHGLENGICPNSWFRISSSTLNQPTQMPNKKKWVVKVW